MNNETQINTLSGSAKKKTETDYMDKYVCVPDSITGDISCKARPCFVYVASGSPKPSCCPYTDDNCCYVWERVV